MNIKSLLLLLSLTSLYAQSQQPQGKPLSVNFSNGAQANTITEPTGLVADGQWQNLPLRAQASVSIQNRATLSIQVKDLIQSSSPVKGVSTGLPDRIFRSQLRTSSFEKDAITITVQSLPMEFKHTGVDVILYWHSSATPRDIPHVQSFSVNGTEKWLVSAGESPETGKFVHKELSKKQVALKSSGTVNTVVFRNITTFPITITTSRDTGMEVKGAASNGGLAGFQLVQAGSAPAEDSN